MGLTRARDRDRPARQSGGAEDRGSDFAFSPCEMGRTIVDRGVICSYLLKGSLDAVLRTVCRGWVIKGRNGKSV